MKKLFAALFLQALAASVCSAQAPPTPGPVAVMGGVTSLATFGTSSSKVLPASTASFPAIMFINDGANEAFVALGGAGVTATTSSTPLPPGNCFVQWTTSANNYIAAITAASTTTVRTLQWNGAPGFSCTNGNISISGGTISVTQSATSNPEVSFQVTTTASYVAFPSNSLTNGLVCIAKSTNTGTPYIGGPGTNSANGYSLASGQPGWSEGINNSNLAGVIGTNTSDVIFCHGN